MNTQWVNPNFPDEIVAGNVDTRNVIDHFKNLEVTTIRERLMETAFPVNVILENFAHDFNIATMVRTVNAFNLKGVTIVGRKKWDRRGAVGTYNYTPVSYEKEAEDYYRSLKDKGEPLIVVDNIEGSVPLPTFAWPEGNINVVFGQESIGVSNVSLKYATHCVSVPQFGSVRSLNVGVCGGIVLYDYTAKVHP